MKNPHQLLGNLDHLHRLQQSLMESLPAEDANRSYHPGQPPLSWYFGRAVYVETLLLRGEVQDETGLTDRVAHIFQPQAPGHEQLAALLPPRDHLLNWALEIFEENLTRLANPSLLPDHALLRDGWLTAMLVQLHSRNYERMLEVLSERVLAQHQEFTSSEPLQPLEPVLNAATVRQGHYRIGAGSGVVFDNELPRQIAELHSFRIATGLVSNAEWLQFMLSGGYRQQQWWSAAGGEWLRQRQPAAPHHWRQDANGNWYAVALQGARELLPHEPVCGISLYEAQAFCKWLATIRGEFAGAAVQHEFQWELAARQGLLEQSGAVREWCWNPFDPYDGYEAPSIAVLATDFTGDHVAVRGATLHTQPSLRRASFRDSAAAAERHHLIGLRLVFPPLPEVWQQ